MLCFLLQCICTGLHKFCASARICVCVWVIIYKFYCRHRLVLLYSSKKEWFCCGESNLCWDVISQKEKRGTELTICFNGLITCLCPHFPSVLISSLYLPSKPKDLQNSYWQILAFLSHPSTEG